MTKAPVSGRVKTRLSPPYSPQQAAEIQQAMTVAVIDKASSLFADTRIAADDPDHPFFRRFDLPLAEQGEGGLGERMSRLMFRVFEGGARAVLFLGTDSPHMDPSRLIDAVKQLANHDVVIGPVEDGGYDLIAMSRPCPELFEDIAWGSQHVLQQTLQRAEAASISVALLDESFDLDTPESLHRASGLWPLPFRLHPGTEAEN